MLTIKLNIRHDSIKTIIRYTFYFNALLNVFSYLNLSIKYELMDLTAQII